MELTYYTSGGGSGTDGGDQYTGLDRFGRVIDQRWDRSGTDLERLKYGYDQVGNRVWRQNTVAEAASANQDEYYTEDGLYQIKTLKRGTLTGTPPTGISGTPTWEEDWNFDPLGNWRGSSSAYKTLVSGTTTLDQNRSHSTVNAISGITTTTGTSWTSPVHDAAGNMTTAPKPLPLGLGSAYTLKYDAWNRLVEVKSGSTVVATYAYDGVNRRVTKTTSVTRHYYYDDRWRVVEERVDAATTADLRFVWGTRRWDDLILRDRIYSSTGGSSSSSSAGPTTERLYVMDDLANVTAVVDTTGTVQERYGYNGFGGVRYMTPSFVTRSASIYYWETLFGSYRYDTETGLYQVRHRYFHPLLGRWINRDPIGERGGINLYAYVGNGPIDRIDIFGLSCNPARCVQLSLIIKTLTEQLGSMYSISVEIQLDLAKAEWVSLGCDDDDDDDGGDDTPDGPVQIGPFHYPALDRLGKLEPFVPAQTDCSTCVINNPAPRWNPGDPYGIDPWVLLGLLYGPLAWFASGLAPAGEAAVAAPVVAPVIIPLFRPAFGF